MRLPGTVESRIVSIVASEVEGRVDEFVAREGTRVEKGDVLARLRVKPLELEIATLEAQLEETLARQKLAERDYDRAKELFAAQVVAQDELDAKSYEFQAWQGRDAQIHAQIDRIKDDIERATIRAPFAGIVAADRTEEGEWLGKGDPVVELMSEQQLEVRVDVPERYLSRFREGASVSLAFSALGDRRVVGNVRTVIPRGSVEARTFPVKVAFQGVAGALPGMSAEAVFPGGERTQQIIVPKDAVVMRGDERIVFVVSGEGTAQPVPVRQGAGIGQWVAVEGPVRPGDKVITRGNERLQPGQPVAAQELEYALP